MQLLPWTRALIPAAQLLALLPVCSHKSPGPLRFSLPPPHGGQTILSNSQSSSQGSQKPSCLLPGVQAGGIEPCLTRPTRPATGSGADCTLHKGALRAPWTTQVARCVMRIPQAAVKMPSHIVHMTVFQQRCLEEEVPLRNYTEAPSIPGLDGHPRPPPLPSRPHWR